MAADILEVDGAAFSYEWFFGDCRLDNWGDVIPVPARSEGSVAGQQEPPQHRSGSSSLAASTRLDADVGSIP